MDIREFLDKPIDGFTVQELVEVYRTNDDGRKTSSVGFFRDEDIAKAFAGCQEDANWHGTDKVLVLTDGKVGFLVGETVTLLDDEKAALEIKQKALAKLTPAERAILKLD